ncbi:MAG TPA: ISAs1 family transposase [Hanamia sp.]|nr:ISAs1 family transposase [Hanamia sp.]
MLAKSEKAFIELFNTIEDSRDDNRLLYPLAEIIFLVVVGVLCCAESWDEIVGFGKDNIKFLRKYFKFEHGIPSKSLLSKVFSIIEKKKMEDFLITFANWLHCNGSGEIIALDGKRIRGSDVHLLHALSTRCGIALAQMDIENKVNESSEIPDFLDKLNIAGAVITADALNCQKEIVKKVIEKKGDYFLALKGNQGLLLGNVKDLFLKKEGLSFYEEADKGHGRFELRRCWSTDKINWIRKEHADWIGLKSLCCIERERHLKGKIQTDVAFYISSTAACPKKHLEYSREHWAVENKLHWILDVVFNEDRTTLSAARSAQNMAVVRKLVINMIRRYKEATGDKIAIKTARKASGWSKDRATKILRYMSKNSIIKPKLAMV